MVKGRVSQDLAGLSVCLRKNLMEKMLICVAAAIGRTEDLI